jgi:RNA polymerase sigma-70 factor (ECF subfamily)
MPIDPAAPTHSAATSASLLFRLRDWRDTVSWGEFYRLYQKLVLGLALRSGLTPSEAEEVAQDVFKRVAETIHEFESDTERGSFRGWLMNLTRWRITDKFRERQRAARLLATPGRDAAPGEDHTATIERVPDPAADAGDAAWEEEWRHHVFDAALARLATRTPARHFQAFELCHRQGWPVLRVARELGLAAPTVYVITHRLKKQLKAEVEKLESQLG